MDASTSPEAVEILVFSDNVRTRQTVMDAAGLNAAFDLPSIKWFEVATAAALKKDFDPRRFKALVLDAESTPEGGESVSRWLHDHSSSVPPVIMLVARPQDEWLSRWSGAVCAVAAPYEADSVVQALHQVLSL